MPNMELRIRMAAESILENEALRGGLNDEQASTSLLNWGIERAKHLAGETAGIEDEEQANEAIYPRMKALRKMLGAIKDLAGAESWGMDELQNGLQLVFNHAQRVYGENWQVPEEISDETWLILQSGQSSERVDNLRNMIETASEQSAPPPSEEPSTPASPPTAQEETCAPAEPEKENELKIISPESPTLKNDRGENNVTYGKKTPI
jgi:hypothetical protein